jgi:hypothetical protein
MGNTNFFLCCVTVTSCKVQLQVFFSEVKKVKNKKKEALVVVVVIVVKKKKKNEETIITTFETTQPALIKCYKFYLKSRVGDIFSAVCILR